MQRQAGVILSSIYVYWQITLTLNPTEKCMINCVYNVTLNFSCVQFSVHEIHGIFPAYFQEVKHVPNRAIMVAQNGLSYINST